MNVMGLVKELLKEAGDMKLLSSRMQLILSRVLLLSSWVEYLPTCSLHLYSRQSLSHHPYLHLTEVHILMEMDPRTPEMQTMFLLGELSSDPG